MCRIRQWVVKHGLDVCAVENYMLNRMQNYVIPVLGKPRKKEEIVKESDPEHYSNLPIEPWDFIQRNKLDFFEGNVIKYICRWKNKGGVSDLRKAITYLEKIIEFEDNR